MMFLYIFCAVSENKKFDYEWDNPVLSLTDKIKFTKNINVALINSQPHDAITFLLLVPLPLDTPLPLKSKVLMYTAGDFLLPLSLSEDALLLLKPKAPMLVAKAVFSRLWQIIQFIKGIKVLARWETPKAYFPLKSNLKY